MGRQRNYKDGERQLSPVKMDFFEFALLPHFRKEIAPPQIRDKNVAYLILKEYFEKCQSNNALPTLTEISMQLGITRREFLQLGKSDPEFGYVFKWAQQTVVAMVERFLLSGRPPIGLIFWLKNNDDWIDKQEIIQRDKSIAEILDEMKETGEVVEGKITTAPLHHPEPNGSCDQETAAPIDEQNLYSTN